MSKQNYGFDCFDLMLHLAELLYAFKVKVQFINVDINLAKVSPLPLTLFL